jgi:hypothetical protein
MLKQTVENFRVLLTSEDLDVLNENLRVVSQEQERLLTLAHHTGPEPEKWAPVANRLRVVAAELRGLEDLSGGAAEQGTRMMADRARELQRLLNKQRTSLETALGGKVGMDLLGQTLDLSKALGEISLKALSLAHDIRPHVVNVLVVLRRDAGMSYASFPELLQENQRLLRGNKIPVEAANALADGHWAAHLDAWKGRGDVEEWRPDSDSYFVNDVRLTTRVLQALRDHVAGDKPETWHKDMQAIERNFRVLESGHVLAELVDGVEHFAVGERWELYNPKSRTTSPHDWVWLNDRLRMIPEEIAHALNFEERRPLAQDVQKIIADAQNQEFTRALQQEMEKRFDMSRVPVSARDQADQLADYLRKALDLFREPMEQARQNLAQLTPTLADTMKQLAKKTEELKEKTMNEAQQAHDKLPDEAKADARQVLTEQQRLNQQIEALKDALRADANQQDILKQEGRERARDADDAVAMLREPPQRAAEDLELAAKSDKAAIQEQALNQAAEQQQKLNQALEKIAEHYDALEKGKPQDTRTALRATEQENGVKDQLDQDYAKAEQMAKLAQSTPEEMLKQLEKALPQNPQMQKELSAISQNTLQGAAEQLKQVSVQENIVAQDVQRMVGDEKARAQNGQPNEVDAANATGIPQPNLPQSKPQPSQNGQQANAQQTPPAAPSPPPQAGQQGSPEANQNNAALAQDAQQQTPIGTATTQVADDVTRAGRHEMRLENKVAGEQLDQLGKQIEGNAQQQIPDAKQALQQAQQAAQAQPAVNAANTGLKKSLEQLNAVANPAQAPADAQGQSKQAQQPEGAQAQANATQATQGKSGQAPAAQQGDRQQAKAQQANAQQGSAQQAGNQQGNASQAAAGQQMQAQAGEQKGQNGQAQAAQNAPANPAGQNALAAQGNPPDIDLNLAAAAPASPQEQVWMARTLDALDAALNSHAEGNEQQATAGGQQGGKSDQAGQSQNAQASQNKSQSAQTSAGQQAGSKPAPQSSAAAKAQAAMAQAAASAAKAQRSEAGSPNQSGEPQESGLQAMSKGGAQQGGNGTHGALGEAKNKAGDWGKLPKQMADQLTQGQQEGIAGEYRNQVETYYRVIAEKSKKP